MTYTNTDVDDNINTLQIEGSPVFNIDDNHLGTNDQTFTGTRTIDMSTFDLYMDGDASTNANFRFVNGGSLHISDDAEPELSLFDGTNNLGTRLYSDDNFGVVGTTTNHEFQLRADNNIVVALNPSGEVNFHEYGAGTFSSGTLSNLLGVTAAGDVMEVDPTTIGSDNQEVDQFAISASDILSISLEDDGVAPLTVDLTPYLDNTDAQDLSLTGNTLSLTNDGTSVDLTPYVNTDDQTIDQFAISASNILSISLEDDAVSPLTVDLTPYLDADADWHLPLGVNNATDILQSIYTFGNVGININDPQYALHVDAGDPSSAGPWAVIEGGSNVRSNVALQLYDEGTAANNENILEFAFNPNTGSASPLSIIRSNTVGNFHANGADLTLETYSAPGTINPNQLVLKNSGNVGIGTATPDAKLDVEGGSVRFTEYGAGTYLDALPAVDAAEYHLAVDAQGDVIETNTVKASKIFYPPAIVIDVSTITTGESIDLWQEYVDRFGTPLLASPSSAGAIPTYGRAELEYYVTDLDGSVFTNYNLDDNGVFTYDVSSVPAGNCTYINVVFVVK